MRGLRASLIVSFCVATGMFAGAAPAAATDYFALDLRHAEFSPEPLGPPAQFTPPGAGVAAIPVATVSEPATSASTRAVAASARRVHTAQVREFRTARRPHRNPLSAYASYQRPYNRPCSARGICVLDGVTGRWHAP
jgi:hypothetical protein